MTVFELTSVVVASIAVYFAVGIFVVRAFREKLTLSVSDEDIAGFLVFMWPVIALLCGTHELFRLIGRLTRGKNAG